MFKPVRILPVGYEDEADDGVRNKAVYRPANNPESAAVLNENSHCKKNSTAKLARSRKNVIFMITAQSNEVIRV